MLTKKPLLPGDSEIDQVIYKFRLFSELFSQLYKIFQLLGTPNENEWSGYTTLPDYQACFPKWTKKNMASVIGPGQPIEAIQLLERVSFFVILSYSQSFK